VEMVVIFMGRIISPKGLWETTGRQTDSDAYEHLNASKWAMKQPAIQSLIQSGTPKHLAYRVEEVSR
jgi:hypothetical protein